MSHHARPGQAFDAIPKLLDTGITLSGIFVETFFLCFFLIKIGSMLSTLDTNSWAQATLLPKSPKVSHHAWRELLLPK